MRVCLFNENIDHSVNVYKYSIKTGKLNRARYIKVWYFFLFTKRVLQKKKINKKYDIDNRVYYWYGMLLVRRIIIPIMVFFFTYLKKKYIKAVRFFIIRTDVGKIKFRRVKINTIRCFLSVQRGSLQGFKQRPREFPDGCRIRVIYFILLRLTRSIEYRNVMITR